MKQLMTRYLFVLLAFLLAVCPSSATYTTPTDRCLMLDSSKFDEFGDVNCEDEMARLDNFANQLNNEPELQGHIIFYGGREYHGRRARRGESEVRAERLKQYLLERRGIDPARIVLVNGGYRENWGAELWLVPSGGEAPAPTPTLEKKDIKFRRGRVRKSEYECGI